MLVAAAFLPHPPLLVPEVAAGAAHELAGVRDACGLALQRVLAADPELVVVVGDAGERSTFRSGARGSFAGFGVPVVTALPGADEAGDGDDHGRPGLPLSLAIGACLMEGLGPWPVVRGEGVPTATTPQDAVKWGEQWVGAAERVALVVMGDGASTLSVKAPGYLVEGAEQWQKQVTQALGDVDVEAVKTISPADADHFQAAGRVAWQVAAGAAAGAQGLSDHLVGEVLADEAPYGVAYVVATWQLASE